MTVRCFFHGHSFKRVASSSHRMDSTNLDTNEILYSVNGGINYLVCSRCGKHSYKYVFPDKVSIDNKAYFKRVTARDERLGALLTQWKNGENNPRVESEITVYDPLYFTDNFINSMLININRSGKQYSDILNSPATRSALEEVENSIKNLQIVIKMQENQKEEK